MPNTQCIKRRARVRARERVSCNGKPTPHCYSVPQGAPQTNPHARDDYVFISLTTPQVLSFDSFLLSPRTGGPGCPTFVTSIPKEMKAYRTHSGHSSASLIPSLRRLCIPACTFENRTKCAVAEKLVSFGVLGPLPGHPATRTKTPTTVRVTS